MGYIPAAPPMYRPGDDKIAELLMRQGDIAAQRAQQSGQIWGNAIAGVGQAAGQAVQELGLKKQDEAFYKLMQSSGGAPDPASVMKIYGPKRGAEITQGILALQQAQQKKGAEALAHAPAILRGYANLSDDLKNVAWPQIRQTAIAAGVADESHLPPQRTPEMDAQLVKWGQGLEGPKEQPKTREVKVRQPDGSETIQIVEDRPGQTFQSAAEPPKPQNLQEVDLSIGGKAVKGTFEPKSGKYYYQGKEVTNPEKFVQPKEPKQPSWQQGEDAEGKPILYDAASGAVKPFPAGVTPKAGAAEAGRIAGAKAALEASSEIRQYLAKPEVRKAVGPLIGRYNSLAQAAGVGDPVAVQLVGMLKSYAAMQPNIHGFRAVAFASDIEKLLSTRQTPQSLEAALNGIDTAAINVRDRGRHPAGAATETGPKQIKTDEDYNSLPSGAEFIDPEGKRRRKP